MSDITTKHYIINYNDITNLPFIDIDTDRLQVINNKLTTIYADTNLTPGKNIDISLDGFINVANTFINNNDINKIYYNGNVGIGTTNPSSLLNIYDSINSSNLLNISENGLILDTNINVLKDNIELGSPTSKINKINCNFLNNIDTTFLTEDNLKNIIFYPRAAIDGIISGITTSIATKSTENKVNTKELFTNSSNYTNEEIVQVKTELKTYVGTQILTNLNNSSNYSEELFINSSNYIDKEITRVSDDAISNKFATNIITELPELVITEEITSLRSETKSVANIIGNYNHASGIILTANNDDNYKSFIILKSIDSSSSVKIYNYDNDNLLISTNNNDKTAPTVILNNRKMILGYDTSEYFASPNTEIYNSINTLEIKGDININGNLKKNNETINLNIWSTQTDNLNYIGDIIFKDLNELLYTAYEHGSLVTIAGDLSSNKQGLIIEKYDRTQSIGITDCSIKQLGSSVNAKLSITSKGNLPVFIGNEINNTLQIYQNRALVDNKLGVNTGQKTLIVPLQVGEGTNTSGATSRSSVAILSGDSGGATELCALSLINSRQGAVGTACSLGFNLSNEWDPSVKINAICTNVPHTADLIFSTHNGTGLSEKMRILANGNIGIGTETPSVKLEVIGDINISTVSSFSTPGFRLQVHTSDDSFSFEKNISGGLRRVYTISSPGDITFSEDVTVNKFLTVTGTSKLLNTLTVGTSDTGESEQLHVKGKARIENELLCENDIVAFANISDKRFKTNISSFNKDDIDIVNRLNPVKFIWKENLFNSNMANKPDIGFIAQEVKEVIPEAVSVCKIEMNDIDYNYIKYERIIPYLVNNIKYLNNKNSNLENKIENLENKNLKLENELEKIKKYLNI